MGGTSAQILVNNFNIISVILEDAALFIGWLLFFTSIYKFKRYGEMRTMMSMHMNILGPISVLLASVFLLMFPQFLGTLIMSIWGKANLNPLPYTGSTTSYGQYITPIIMFVRIIGMVSIIRGILLLSRTGEQQSQPGQAGKAGLHILGGLLSVHIMYTIDLLKSIFGLNF